MRTPLQKGEKVLLITHSSWTTLLAPAFFSLATTVLAIFVLWRFAWVYSWIIILIAILYFVWRYRQWKVNIWVVTNFRVIDESGLVSHYAKESPLDKINNVSYDQTPAGRLFNYGHVEIQTAAEVGATDYYNVNHPRKLKDTITAAQADYRTWQFGTQAAQMAAAMDARNAALMGNPAVPRTDAPQVAAELEKLFELKMKGALSEEEYNRAKSRLLGQ